MLENDSKTWQVIETIGGASRDRTDDLIVANDALSQLSYSPPVNIHDFIIALSGMDPCDPHPLASTGLFIGSSSGVEPKSVF